MNVLDLPDGTEEDESVLTIPLGMRAKQIWCKKGRYLMHWHRIRGPALILKDGTELWYRDNKEYEPTAHELMMWEMRNKNECS